MADGMTLLGKKRKEIILKILGNEKLLDNIKYMVIYTELKS